jgi:ATP-binding cassette, subfamily B, bacterial
VRTLKMIFGVVPYWTSVWACLLIVLGLLPAATVYLTKLTIESFVAAGNNLSVLNTSLFLAAAVGVTLVATELARFSLDWVRAVQADTLTDHLKGLIQAKAIEVDLEFYESPDYYDLLEQARSDSISRPLTLLESFGSIFQNGITLLTFSALLLSYGWWVPILLLLGALPALHLYVRSERVMHAWVKASAPDRRWLSYLESAVTTDQTAAEIRIFNLGDHFRTRYAKLSRRLRSERMHHVGKRYRGRLFAGLLTLTTSAIGVGWIAMRVLQKTATLGDLAVFYQIFTRGQAIIQSLLGGVNQAFSSGLYLENLFEFLDLSPRGRAPEQPVDFPDPIRIGIRFSNVTFAYPGTETPALENFSLFIPVGKIVAVVGVNGAGKSTLVKLLCRFYVPQEGSIEIDGIDIANFDPQELRRNLSAQFQFPANYHETAGQNIACGDVGRVARPEEIESAARAAGAHDFVSKLPKGYDTMLGRHFADGWELSGGQWQRLTLARAYFRDAPILILDEPTSFMDSWSEAEWFDHLRELLTGRTGLVITHRFTIAMRADIIMVVDNGKIIESGTHNELLTGDGFYAQSWKSQMEASKDGKPAAANQ